MRIARGWQGAAMAAMGLSCVMASAGVLAAPPPPAFYVGVGTGDSHHVSPASYYADNQPEGFEGHDPRQSDAAYTLYGGFRPNPYMALEASVSDFGSATRWDFGCPDSAMVCPHVEDNYQERIGTRAAGIAFVAILPVQERFEMFAKLGLSRNRHQAALLAGQRAYGQLIPRYTTTPLLAAGASYLFNPAWAVRLQWERQESPVRNHWFKGKTAIRVWTLSLEHRFGTRG